MVQIQKLVKIALIFLFMLLIIPNEIGYADGEEQITVSMKVGFDNSVKRSQGFPVAVSLKNNGNDISGELVIAVSPGYRNNGTIVREVDLPANSEKTIYVSLPGLSDYYGSNTNSQHIYFYEGSWQDGKEIPLGGQTKLTPSYLVDDQLIIGLLTQHPDSLNYMRNVQSQYGNSYTNLSLDALDFPNDPLGLSMFNLIVIDQYSVAEELSLDQQEALKDWISAGGKLIVGADQGLQQKTGDILPLLPMETTLTSETVSTEFFNNGEREFPQPSIELLTGEMGDGTKVLQKTKDGLPVVVSKDVGNGEVVQLAFSLSGQTFSSWDGAPDYWLETLQPIMQLQSIHYESIYERLGWGIAETTSLFPSSFLPFSTLVLIFVGYTLVIFPGIYFLLRKMDKREHSWWILPALSLVVCLGIFGFGGKDRIAQPQINEMSVIQLDGHGYGHGYGSISLLSNKNGNYELNVPVSNFSAFPIDRNYYGGDTQMEPKGGIRQQGDQVDLLFKDVEYWSIRNASGPISNLEVGAIVYDLHIDDKNVTGTITNTTNVEFEDLLFMSGRQEESLGSLGAGETIEVSFELQGAILQAPTWRNYNYSQHQDLDKQRKEDLMRMIYEFNMFDRGKPALVGLTSDGVLNSSLKDSNALYTRMNVVIQSLHLADTIVGPYSLETDDFSPSVYMMEHSYGYLESDLEMGGRNVFASDGIYEFGYTVPAELQGEQPTYSELEVRIRNTGFKYEIFNVETESYETLTDSNSFDNPETYITEYGYIAIRVEKGDTPEQLPVPELSLKGEVIND
ncbi:DUF7408 domain-containing protein [Evansella tamaricis]|uniref:DUF7408 domain-containing protein n=1 Tax=Evansella tamaricis TaxID=2069301 RepID=A0ABS6JL12_9BACI|nr:hypothetical protein [Evansella tamaricis]MBU9713105.1 hypothetical protein [Evansella tamaricis]